MKQKKMYENQRDQLMNQSFNMEQTNFCTQSMQDTVLQVNAMKTASQAMKTQMKAFNIGEIEDMQDDLQEMMDQSNEVMDILSRSYDMPFDVDEADLEQELQDLELDEVEDEIPSYLTDTDASVTNLDSLPRVPQPLPTGVPNAPQVPH
eukprot:TRINITY_DN8241_c0_g1_i1.p1 TRINITY_DN8241_c0_g1~~TRINITY_DN8241_c0_g1_i1.p1  ORF type:complete len:149 (+),score=29.50 TRINITY_DN8241_c0_g1_i1:296-742(+)